MANDLPARPEALRLEQLWAGTFGDEYVERNAGAYEQRGPFWDAVVERHGVTSVLEVGCNVGGNLRWLARRLPQGRVYGVDINRSAIARLHADLPEVNALWCAGRELPFRDRWFDLVFTMGVLIHQPESTLPLVMAEMVRCSARLVLCGEYYAPETVEVPYRGQEGALFRRDYGGRFAELFPELELVEQGFLGRAEGWDDVTWWLFRRS
jgi:spore coat polysaccharide biosynthesis protein SpsF